MWVFFGGEADVFLIDFCGLALISVVEKLLVLLRDGRKLMGTLRSFDQFGTSMSLNCVKFWHEISLLAIMSPQ